MPVIYVPSKSPDDWQQFLAEPAKQWRVGYSARTLACAWEAAQGLPAEVHRALSVQFPDIELLLAIPEHQVPLPGGRRKSQNDVWALARAGGQLVSIAVEGKVSEPFGPTVEDWLVEDSPGKRARMAYLTDLMALKTSVPLGIRYQLLHRTASAIIEAKRFCATHAVMLVHSFSRSGEWFEDYRAFAALFDVAVNRESLAFIGTLNGVRTYLCWAQGDERFLSR